MKRPWAVAASAMVFALGCGGAKSDADEVRERLDTYLEAAADDDFETLCELYDPRILAAEDTQMLEKAAAAQEGLSERERDEFREAEITRVRLDGATARVTTSIAEEPVELVRLDGDWYLTGIERP